MDKQNEIIVDGICCENPLNLLIFFTWNFFDGASEDVDVPLLS